MHRWRACFLSCARASCCRAWCRHVSPLVARGEDDRRPGVPHASLMHRSMTRASSAARTRRVSLMGRACVSLVVAGGRVRVLMQARARMRTYPESFGQRHELGLSHSPHMTIEPCVRCGTCAEGLRRLDRQTVFTCCVACACLAAPRAQSGACHHHRDGNAMGRRLDEAGMRRRRRPCGTRQRRRL